LNQPLLKQWQLFGADFRIDALETASSDSGRITTVDEPIRDCAFKRLAFFKDKLDGRCGQSGVDWGRIERYQYEV